MITEDRGLDEKNVQNIDPDAHLQRLLNPGYEESWGKAALQNLKDFFNPPKLPPLEITSKPAEVQDIWKSYDIAPKRSRLISALSTLGIHVLVIALLFLVFRVTPLGKKMDRAILIYAPLGVYQPPPQKQIGGGGGGGGAHAPKPVSKGEAPKFAPKQFMPPAAVVPQPKLPMVPTITAEAPKLDSSQYADPLSKTLPFSMGEGANGMGKGSGHGVGSGDGNGYGAGSGGGMGGGVFRIGGGVSAPIVLSKTEPEYSEEARKAKYQGTVVLTIVVDAQGMPRNIKVIRPLGLGLDEKAIEAVEKWRFRPAMKDGKPVNVQATVEVNFRLL